jgi:hypothetical protein
MTDIASDLAAPARRSYPRFDRGRLLRLIREWHGYLSALAFAALILFSATGLLLNHPEWLDAASATTQTTRTRLPADVLSRASKSDDPARLLAAHLAQDVSVRGFYASGEIFEDEALLRFESPRGASEAAIDLQTGEAELIIRRAHPITMLNELHRGKNAGPQWKAMIDAVAALTLVMSLLGYGLFLVMRRRIALALSLSVVGLAALVAAAFVFVS